MEPGTNARLPPCRRVSHISNHNSCQLKSASYKFKKKGACLPACTAPAWRNYG